MLKVIVCIWKSFGSWDIHYDYVQSPIRHPELLIKNQFVVRGHRSSVHRAYINPQVCIFRSQLPTRWQSTPKADTKKSLLNNKNRLDTRTHLESLACCQLCKMLFKIAAACLLAVLAIFLPLIQGKKIFHYLCCVLNYFNWLSQTFRKNCRQRITKESE